MDNVEKCKRFVVHLKEANPELKDIFKKVDEIPELSTIFKKQKSFLESSNKEDQNDTLDGENK